jgi:predicted RNA polymerase sigma factor
LSSSERIVLLYEALLQVIGTRIVALNHAVAVGMAQGRSPDSMRWMLSRLSLR